MNGLIKISTPYMVYRADDREPKEIFANGFIAHNPSNISFPLEMHQRGDEALKYSPYISTSLTKDEPLRLYKLKFNYFKRIKKPYKKVFYIYTLVAYPENSIDVNKFLAEEASSLFSKQEEIAIVGKILPEQIYSAIEFNIDSDTFDNETKNISFINKLKVTLP